mmetsp:Transcript_27449/g.82703  ORF Transcript_27449/g.82703 Transcript_27449/m.82703 type:complete len:228 (-) Transcript_27449:33-716(-)
MFSSGSPTIVRWKPNVSHARLPFVMRPSTRALNPVSLISWHREMFSRFNCFSSAIALRDSSVIFVSLTSRNTSPGRAWTSGMTMPSVLALSWTSKDSPVFGRQGLLLGSRNMARRGPWMLKPAAPTPTQHTTMRLGGARLRSWGRTRRPAGRPVAPPLIEPAWCGAGRPREARAAPPLLPSGSRDTGAAVNWRQRHGPIERTRSRPRALYLAFPPLYTPIPLPPPTP